MATAEPSRPPKPAVRESVQAGVNALFACLCAVVVALLVAVPTSAQTTGWQRPEQISEPTAFLHAPRVAFNARDDALVTWQANAGRRTFADPSSGPGTASSRWALRRRTAAWQRERSTARFLPSLLPYARGRAVALWLPERGALYAVWIDLDRGRIWRTEALDRSAERIDGYALDVSPFGDAVVAWSALKRRRHRIFVATARAGKPSFGRARAFSAPSGVTPEVDVNPRADAIVAWQRTGLIEARVRRGHGGFGRTQQVGTTENAYSMSAAAGPGGRAAVAWATQSFCCGDGGEPTGAARLKFAYASPPGRFHRGTVVGGLAGVADGSPQVVFDGGTDGELVWLTERFGGTLQAAHFRTTSVGAAQTLDTSTHGGASDLRLVRLVSTPGGGAIAAWLHGDLAFRPDLPTRLMTSMTPGAGNPFRAPEAASPLDHDVAYADVAVDHRQGRRPLAVWSRERGGVNGRVMEVSEYR
jgi:hypothetical protein